MIEVAAVLIERRGQWVLNERAKNIAAALGEG
jgi:hypothetical protein